MKDMDHVTSHAISELASQLGRPLRDELKFSISELNSHIELFRKSLQEISSSMKDSEDSLKFAARELLPKIKVARNELDSAVNVFNDSAQSLKGGFFENLDIRIDALMEKNERIVSTLRDELSNISKDLRLVEKVLEKSSSNLTETNQKLDKTTSVFRKEIDNWNGLLKATSHAQTKELEAFSSEISELINSMKNRVLEEIDEKINLRDNRVRQDIAENNVIFIQLLNRVARIEKFIWAIACIMTLTIIIVLFLL